MNELSTEGRALFEAARETDGPAEADRRRIRSRLDARLALLVAAAPAGTAAASVATSGGAALLVKVAVGAVLVAGGGFATWRAVHSERPRPPAPVVITTVPAPSESEPEPEAEEDEPAQPDSVLVPPRIHSPHPVRRHLVRHVPSRSAVPAPAAPPDPVSAEDSLRAEVQLLSQAQQAMRTGRPQVALALLEQHAEEFPHGKLRQERLAAKVLALCELGRGAEARQEAQRFLQEAPTSPLVERVRGSCAFQPAP